MALIVRGVLVLGGSRRSEARAAASAGAGASTGTGARTSAGASASTRTGTGCRKTLRTYVVLPDSIRLQAFCANACGFHITEIAAAERLAKAHNETPE